MTGKSTRDAGGGSFDDPNREAIGLAPIWTGAGEPPPPPPEADESQTSSAKRKTAKDDE